MFDIPQKMFFQGRISTPRVAENLYPGRFVKILEQKKRLSKVNSSSDINSMIYLPSNKLT